MKFATGGGLFDLSGRFNTSAGTSTCLVGRTPIDGGGDILVTLAFDYQSLSAGFARQMNATVASGTQGAMGVG